MNNKSFIIIFIFIIGLSTVHGRREVQDRNSCEEARRTTDHDANKVERLIFNQWWSSAFCYKLLQRKSLNDTSHLCNDKKWLIGGLWPSLDHQTGPAFCNCLPDFDTSRLSSIITDLKTKWVNGNNNYTFLNNQWLKHGTCGATIDGIDNQFKYFNKSLEIFDKFNIYKILSNATINPGKEYRTTEIEDALKLKLGKKSQLKCIRNRATQEYYLAGIRICFDLSFNLIDCEGNNTRLYHYTCPQNKGLTIYLDSIPH